MAEYPPTDPLRPHHLSASFFEDLRPLVRFFLVVGRLFPITLSRTYPTAPAAHSNSRAGSVPRPAYSYIAGGSDPFTADRAGATPTMAFLPPSERDDATFLFNTAETVSS